MHTVETMKNLVIINGQINTMNPRQPFASALAIRDGRIICVGTDEEIKKVMPPDAEVIDAGGNSVFPGFIDTHVHFMMTGQDAAAVQLGKAKTRGEFMRLLTEKEKELKPGMWLQGTGYDETQFPEKTLPPVEELDRAFPDRPVFVGRMDAHQVYLNTAAFKALGLSAAEHGVVTDDRGKFTGVIKDPANGLARTIMSDKLITDEMRREYLHIASQEALKKGTTSLCALEGGTLCNEKDVPVYLKYKDELPVHTYLLHQVMDVDKVIAEGQRSIGGCIVLDGSMGSRTAAMFEDYADMPGCRGELYYTQKEVDDFVMEAHSKGLQISMHCIGDLAIEVLLQAYEKALAKYPRADHRHRFEHFGVPTPDQIERARRLGCCLAVQPAYVFSDSAEKMHRARLGAERQKRACMLRTLLDKGFVLGGGSDASVTPISPFRGIAAAMNHYNPAERISLYEALKMFTIDAARLTFQENEKGTLEVGKLGDVAIIEGDIRTMDTSDKDAFDNIRFLYTIVKGEIKYRAE